MTIPPIRPTSVFIHPTAVVDEPCSIGRGAKVWHFCHVREHAHIGEGTQLGQGVYVGRGVRIGAFTKVQNNVSIYESVELGDEVFCGPSCVFTNVINPRAAIERKEEFLPTHVLRGATIGANATILCGITIGRWAMIAAGAVVTTDVPDFALMVGVPARRVGWFSIHGVRLPEPGADGRTVCPVTGREYQIGVGGLLELMGDPPPVKVSLA